MVQAAIFVFRRGEPGGGKQGMRRAHKDVLPWITY
jgi:hypothetical protein